MGAIVWEALTACGGPDGTGVATTAVTTDLPAPPTDTVSETDTGAETSDTGTHDTAQPTTVTVTGTGPGVVKATCAPQIGNILRFDCTVELDAPGAASISFQAAGEDMRTVRSDEVGLVHAITLYRMHENTRYDWTAASDGGPSTLSAQITTGSLPASVDFAPVISAPGTPTVGDTVFPFSCSKQGMLVAIDADGRVVWYQDTADLLGLDLAMGVTGSQYVAESNSIVAVLGHDRIVEVSAEGELMASFVRDIDFTGAVHHDVTKRDGRIYALYADEYTYGDEDWVLDGVLVFEDGLLVGDWNLFGVADFSGWLPPGAAYWGLEFTLATDISHANGIMVNDDGSLLLSLRHLHTVMEIEGYDSPSFGDIRWTFVGQPLDGVPLDATYLPTSSAHILPVDFQVQHHASMTRDGALIFLDNRESPAISSRVVEWVLDDDAGVGDLIQTYELDDWCVVQGGVYELPSGNLLATCATSQRLYEFDRSGVLQWTFEPECGGFAFGSLVRASPVSW